MKASNLLTDNPRVALVEPDVKRDAPISLKWLEGPDGCATLKLMGVPDHEICLATIKQEEQRIKDFVDNPNQLNWMIKLNGKVVGSVWVDLNKKYCLPSPSVHIMIGSPSARGMGVGSSAMACVLEYLKGLGFSEVYSRHLCSNDNAKKLLRLMGFIDVGEPYTDKDGLEWQNVKKSF